MRRFILFYAALLALLVLLMRRFPDALAQSGNDFQLVYYILLIALISAMAARSKLSTKHVALYMAAWAALGLALVAGYAYKDALLNSRLAAVLLPSRPHVENGNAVSFRAAPDGHFYVDALVNNVSVNFLVDTGASDIVLSREDAIRTGLSPDSLNYTRIYRTANGAAAAAPVTLNSLVIGPFETDEIPAAVNKGAFRQSLLGMRFLEMMGSVRIEDDTLTLTPKN